MSPHATSSLTSLSFCDVVDITTLDIVDVKALLTGLQNGFLLGFWGVMVSNTSPSSRNSSFTLFTSLSNSFLDFKKVSIYNLID